MTGIELAAENQRAFLLRDLRCTSAVRGGRVMAILAADTRDDRRY